MFLAQEIDTPAEQDIGARAGHALASGELVKVGIHGGMGCRRGAR